MRGIFKPYTDCAKSAKSAKSPFVRASQTTRPTIALSGFDRRQVARLAAGELPACCLFHDVLSRRWPQSLAPGSWDAVRYLSYLHERSYCSERSMTNGQAEDA